ncbi:MAG: 4'-phosphopantetheinyl transferase superfamily protein, partial [Chthoniobacterales bacterium]
ASDRDVGIDLEAGERLPRADDELRKIAERVLSAGEFAAWQTLPDVAARRAAFLRAWVRKEAFMKATGRGISESFAATEVALDAADPQRTLLLRRPDRGEWQIYDLPAPAGFCAAIAVAVKHQVREKMKRKSISLPSD